MSHSRLLVFVAFALLTVPTAGCSSRADARTHAETVPPFRADPEAPHRLVVREDLLAKMKLSEVSTSDVQARITGYGRLKFASDAAYAVRAPFPSYVERVLVGPGDRIRPGQPLAELRSSDLARLRAELARAEVQVRVDKQATERLEPLVQDGTATRRELHEAQARLEVAEAELASARQALAAVGPTGGRGERYTLRAAAGGSIIRRNVTAGERIGPEDEPAFLIGDPNRIVVRAAFPDRDAMWLKEGESCSFTVHALGTERFSGTITRVLRAVDPKTRSAEAICTPHEQRAEFSAEMVSRVEVRALGEGRLVVPRSALLMKRDEWVVFVRTDANVVERRHVRPGITIGDRVQVAEGLQVGEEVIVEGAVLLDGELDVLL